MTAQWEDLVATFHTPPPPPSTAPTTSQVFFVFFRQQVFVEPGAGEWPCATGCSHKLLVAA